MKFFFEQEEPTVEKPTEDQQFFFMLKEAGVVQQPGDKPEGIESDAKMRSIKSSLLEVEFGTYRDNYAIHLTPIHPKKNISDEQKVYEAMRELVIIMNQYVPQTLQVKLHPPKPDWKMKVISAVIEGGATAWNFDLAAFEEKGIPDIQAAIEKVIMR